MSEKGIITMEDAQNDVIQWQAELKKAKLLRASVLDRLEKAAMQFETIANALKTKPERVRIGVPKTIINLSDSDVVIADSELVNGGLTGLGGLLSQLHTVNGDIEKYTQKLKSIE